MYTNNGSLFTPVSLPRMKKHMKAKSIDWYQEPVRHEDIEVSKIAVDSFITKHVRGPGTNGRK